MLKSKILFPKRSKPIVQDEEAPEFSSKPRRIPLKIINQQFAQKLTLHGNSKNEQNWSKREQENLLICFFEKIVTESYIDFTWNFFMNQENLTKISKMMTRTSESCSRKINQIKSVNEEKYSKLNVIDFLMVHWKSQEFKDKIGRDLIEKIKKLKTTKSDHMVMLDQMMGRMKDQEPAFDRLFELIMRN